jgi:hypothetical protein
MTATRVRPLNPSANLAINHPITQFNYPTTRLPDYPIQVHLCPS